MTPLAGSATRNKGMALFPRKIDGRYAMIGRQDNENLYLIYSDDLYTWEGGRSILQPEYPWEFVQIGSCGSPIELDDCWLLLTHGVGPVRKYSIGAVLLDKKDPSKVLARSREPLVRPEPAEREGYVPNVVYTCGAMRHRDQIILPYAVSDTFSKFRDDQDRGSDAGYRRLMALLHWASTRAQSGRFRDGYFLVLIAERLSMWEFTSHRRGIGGVAAAGQYP